MIDWPKKEDNEPRKPWNVDAEGNRVRPHNCLPPKDDKPAGPDYPGPDYDKNTQYVTSADGQSKIPLSKSAKDIIEDSKETPTPKEEKPASAHISEKLSNYPRLQGLEYYKFAREDARDFLDSNASPQEREHLAQTLAIVYALCGLKNKEKN